MYIILRLSISVTLKQELKIIMIQKRCLFFNEYFITTSLDNVSEILYLIQIYET